MRTLSTTAVVSSNHTLTLQVPADIAPGIHEVVVVLREAETPMQAGELFGDWPAHKVGPTDPTCTYRREDLYGDGDR